MAMRLKFFLFKLAAKATGGVVVYQLIHSILQATKVVDLKVSHSLGFMFFAMIIGLFLTSPLKWAGRFIFFFIWFAAIYIGTFYALKAFGGSIPSGFTAVHKVYLGVVLGVPLILSTIFYRMIMDFFWATLGKIIRAIGSVLAWPFKKIYKISLVNKLISKLFPSSNVDINLSMEQIDALGNGYTYMKGRLFEEYIAQVYKRLNMAAMTTTEMRRRGLLPPSIQKRGGSGEQGVDVVVEMINSQGQKKRLIIQCKHYSGKVENSAIQQIVTAKPLYEADYTAVITNQFFTDSAKELAHIHKVTLIDRKLLPELIQNAVKCYEETRKH